MSGGFGREEQDHRMADTSKLNDMRVKYVTIHEDEVPRGKEKTGKQRDPVPRVVLSKRPACFHAYLLALNFAFAGAAMTMSLREKWPKATMQCRRLACLAATAAVGALAWSVAVASLGPVNFPMSQVAEASGL
ncbi:hypothetical protein NL676_037736 [Syzygium grande]|nr:hypothetical protein NL676_037736 [Syzygium grande]